MSVELKTASVAIASTSGVAAVISAVSEVAVQILGVPLPVLLAAVTGAWIARSYTPASNFFSALIATFGWTAAGCILAPLAAALLELASIKLPTNALAGVALIVSAGLPLVLPILKEEVPKVVRARLEKWKGGGS